MYDTSRVRVYLPVFRDWPTPTKDREKRRKECDGNHKKSNLDFETHVVHTFAVVEISFRM